MANAIRIHTQVTSETLHIPELSALVGKNVEVIILEEEPAPRRPTPPARKLGALRGLFDVPEDFDAPLPEDMLRAFEGDGER
ncbi:MULTISPECIES: hypothetical protein [unclassified Sorangium]|uniref:Prevent-host-death protein n=1 Tax=Sorangium cellulosum TaxID=56 RepID=A0A150T1D4_SORCE|nr:hypothetical protein BE20_35705 [Sorangium cellulosum]KYG03462.1 hypothetical protein BE18_36485 [Sorangium cellulosum]